jgi:5,10-methylenetetrahydromethanopterin reductase
MDISCAFATSSDAPTHVQLAETLGYRRAWLYDSPALQSDVWMILSRCAERTSRIGLGPGVLVPSLRHPMVNAAAIAELADQAPGRAAVAVGSGFTGRFTLGKRPMPWREVAEYVRCLRALLAGETSEPDSAHLASPNSSISPPDPTSSANCTPLHPPWVLRAEVLPWGDDC